MVNDSALSQAHFGNITPECHIYGYISAVLACMLANHEIFSLHFSMPIGGSCEAFLDDVLYGNTCASVVWDGPAIQRGST